MNELFLKVKSADDAALDSRLLLKAADLGLKRARAMKLDISVFDIDEFLVKISERMRPNLDNPTDIDWYALKPQVTRCSARPAVPDFMFGPLAVKASIKERKKINRYEKNKGEVVKPAQV